MTYPRNTNGTTMDGVLDALVALIEILKNVYGAQVQTVGAGTDANQMTAQVAAKIDTAREAIAAGTAAAGQQGADQAKRDAAILAELQAQTKVLNVISAQLQKGLLVQTVAKL